MPSLLLSLGLVVCASRLVLMVGALVRLSALSLLAVCLLPLLVRLSASRCLWLWLPGLPRAAPGAALLVWLLLLSLRPCLPWLLPLSVVLRLLVFSFPRLVPRALPWLVAPSFVRARVGPAARLLWGAGGGSAFLLWRLVCRLLRSRR